MSDLERRLTDLGDHLDVPMGQGLAAAVTARLADQRVESDRRWRRWWRWVAGAVLVGVGAGVAPALADWLGIGGVAVHQAPAPSTPTVRYDLGRPVDLADVRHLAGFDPIVPAALGEPSDVWVDDRRSTPVIWLHWEEGPLITELKGGLADGPVLHKYAPGVTINEVQIDRIRGLWVGGPHEVVLDSGEMSAPAAQYAAEGTLIMEVGPITIRIETDQGRDEAVRIARSVPGT